MSTTVGLLVLAVLSLVNLVVLWYVGSLACGIHGKVANIEARVSHLIWQVLHVQGVDMHALDDPPPAPPWYSNNN